MDITGNICYIKNMHYFISISLIAVLLCMILVDIRAIKYDQKLLNEMEVARLNLLAEKEKVMQFVEKAKKLKKELEDREEN